MYQLPVLEELISFAVGEEVPAFAGGIGEAKKVEAERWLLAREMENVRAARLQQVSKSQEVFLDFGPRREWAVTEQLHWLSYSGPRTAASASGGNSASLRAKLIALRKWHSWGETATAAERDKLGAGCTASVASAVG